MGVNSFMPLRGQFHGAVSTRELYLAPTNVRQREAVRLRALKWTSAEIAKQLKVAERTISRYLQRAAMLIGSILIREDTQVDEQIEQTLARLVKVPGIAMNPKRGQPNVRSTVSPGIVAVAEDLRGRGASAQRGWSLRTTSATPPLQASRSDDIVNVIDSRFIARLERRENSCSSVRQCTLAYVLNANV
jgi:DNA-binding CsgD family transcriptional regulator